MSEDDVFSFYMKLMQKYEESIPLESVEAISALMNDALSGTT
jgi:hypothetical protein